MESSANEWSRVTEEKDGVVTILDQRFPLDFKCEYTRGNLKVYSLGERMVDNIQRLAQLLSLNLLRIIQLDLGGNHTFQLPYSVHVLILYSHLGYLVSAEAIKHIAESLRSNTTLSELDLLRNQKNRKKKETITNTKILFFLKKNLFSKRYRYRRNQMHC
jgi:hypothetical protein